MERGVVIDSKRCRLIGTAAPAVFPPQQGILPRGMLHKREGKTNWSLLFNLKLDFCRTN